jgi:hypothetical protein
MQSNPPAHQSLTCKFSPCKPLTFLVSEFRPLLGKQYRICGSIPPGRVHVPSARDVVWPACPVGKLCVVSDAHDDPVDESHRRQRGRADRVLAAVPVAGGGEVVDLEETGKRGWH